MDLGEANLTHGKFHIHKALGLLFNCQQEAAKSCWMLPFSCGLRLFGLRNHDETRRVLSGKCLRCTLVFKTAMGQLGGIRLQQMPCWSILIQYDPFCQWSQRQLFPRYTSCPLWCKSHRTRTHLAPGLPKVSCNHCSTICKAEKGHVKHSQPPNSQTLQQQVSNIQQSVPHVSNKPSGKLCYIPSTRRSHTHSVEWWVARPAVSFWSTFAWWMIWWMGL